MSAQRLMIAGTPPLHLYADPAALDHIPPGDRAAQILLGVGDIDASVEDLNPDLAVTLDNRSGQAADLLHSAPPIDLQATLYADGVEVFTGVVDTINMGAQCVLRIAA